MGGHRAGPDSSSENGALSTWTIKQGLSQNSIRALFEDHEGNLWIGTDGGGLNRLKRNPLRIFGAQQGFQGGAVMSLAEGSAGAIWAGLNGGGLRYGPADSEGHFSESGILPEMPSCGRSWSREMAGFGLGHSAMACFVGAMVCRGGTTTSSGTNRSRSPGDWRPTAPP